MLWVFRAVVTAHLAIIVGNLVALFCLPFLTPWYIALPIETVLVNLMFSSVPCPLTRLESKLRQQLGMPEIKHFVGYYIVWPIREWWHARSVRSNPPV